MTIMDVLSKAVQADDAAGAALIDCVVYDFLNDLIEINKSDLNEVYGMWALDRVQIAKRTLAKSYVDTVAKGFYPSDDAQQTAMWLAGIERYVVDATRGKVSKAADNEWWTVGNRRVQRQVARDAQGRFTRGVNQNLSRTVSPTDKERMAPALRSFSDGGKWIGGMTVEDAAAFQGKYDEALGFANELKNALPKGVKADLVAMVQGPDGRIRNERTSIKNVSNNELSMPGLRADDKILGVEVAPSMGATAQDSARIAEFNLLGGAGGSALAQLANTDPKLRTQLAQSLKMPEAKDDKSNMSRIFGILSSGGAVLSGVSGAEKIGQMAALVGTMGPQAEEVLGPYVKRSAYRYRGTEKTPDKELRDPQATLTGPQIDKIARDFSLSTGVALEMHARADAASSILAETIPQDPIIARLSEASGQVLPSQGVIYDQNGKLVSQSVGFTDDHYLPFDLMNLGRLRGGQYVRTRQQGGLTGEDIYTAVMSGARQVQVVSGSGVFSLEMAPDFRGARAMSDKARGMYDRYLKILDAVDESGLYLEDITPKEKQQMWADARATLGDSAEDADVKALAEANIERARRNAQTIDPADEEWAAENALREVGLSPRQGEDAMTTAQLLRGKDRRVFEDAYEENLEQRRASKTNKLRLNGEGYAVALKTLQEQFPYFIADVRYRELNQLPTDKPQNAPKTRRYAQDAGYTQPGALRAKGVRTGFYNPGEIEPGAKTQRNRPAVSEQKTETTTAAPETQGSSEPQRQEAAPVGVNASMKDSSRVLDKSITDSAGALAEAAASLPIEAVALNRNASLPFGALTDKTERVKWLLTQSKSSNVVDALSGVNADKAAEALADPEAIRNGLTQLLQSEGIDDWFASGNTFGGQRNTDDAIEWIMDKGKMLGESAAMKQGLAPAPSSIEEQVKYRGLMPMQMSGIALIADKNDFEKFVSNAANNEVTAIARALAFKGDEMRSIPQVAELAAQQLDSISVIGQAKEDLLKKVRANPSAPIPKLSSFVTDSEWRAATGESLPDDVSALTNYDSQGESLKLQQAWSLAVTARVISVMDGGDVWDPKALSQMLALVEKAHRRPLVDLMGQPIVLQ